MLPVQGLKLSEGEVTDWLECDQVVKLLNCEAIISNITATPLKINKRTKILFLF